MTQRSLDRSTPGSLDGELDPLRYDVHLDAPQEVASMLADLVPGGIARVGCRLWYGIRVPQNRGHSEC